MRIDLINKLWEKTETNKNGCWLYIGTLRDGYGLIYIDGIKARAVHRLSLCIFLGLKYKDHSWLACHINSCGNKTCWNPTHLYPGTQVNNMADMINTSKGAPVRNANKEFCDKGHAFDFENTYNYKGRRQCRKCANINKKARRSKGFE